MLKLLSIIVILLFVVPCQGQSQPKLDYVALRSEGEIPAEFLLPSYKKMDVQLAANRAKVAQLKLEYKKAMNAAETEKEQILIKRNYEANYTKINKQQQQIFAENTVYGIDEILHSGLVLYGDSLSKYVTTIAEKLLVNDVELFQKLQFYTLKVNEVNAFSTDQGIIFCTVGLLSQIENEAQLAYILAHEIAHYTEKHVLESYVYSSSGRTNREDYQGQIRDMGKFSKSSEFEADTLAITLFHAAGYDKKEIENTFNLLLYAYLPFEERQLEVSYFNQGYSYIPPSQFPQEERPITAMEDKNDLNSTHPNIKSRKELAASQLENYDNWGSSINSLGDEWFLRVQRIARFESLRNNLFESEYGKALYTLFLLENKYPNSLYLARCKAQTWLGLAQFKAGAKFSKTVDRKKALEGESANMHLLLYEMDNKTINTMALRQIKDVLDVFPTDQMILLVWDRIIKVAAENDKFILEDYRKESFSVASNQFYTDLRIKDSISKQPIPVEAEQPKQSKYERIKSNKKKVVVNSRTFDSTLYYQYLIPDLIVDSSFISIYKSHKEENKISLNQMAQVDNLRGRKKYEYQKSIERNQLAIGARDVVLVEPVVTKYRDGVIDRVQSEVLASKFSTATLEASESLGMTVYPVDKSTLSKTTTPGFNERSCLMQLMSQLANADDLNVFPVDYEMLEEVKENYGTSTVVFSFVANSYDIDFDYNAIYAALIFPIGMIYFPSKIFSGNSTSMNLVVLDLDKGQVVCGQNTTFQQPVSKGMLKGRVYDILYQLKQKPTKL